jgi:hypothetical protein
MRGTIAHRREVVTLLEIGNTSENTAATAHPLVEMVIHRQMSVVIDTGAKSRPSLDQRDLQTGFREAVCRDPAARAATDNAHVENTRSHTPFSFGGFLYHTPVRRRIFRAG